MVNKIDTDSIDFAILIFVFQYKKQKYYNKVGLTLIDSNSYKAAIIKTHGIIKKTKTQINGTE